MPSESPVDYTGESEATAKNDYDYDHEGAVNTIETPTAENDKNPTVRERECKLLSNCYFYNQLLKHPSIPRTLVEKDLKKENCGFDSASNETKGKGLFQNWRVYEYVALVNIYISGSEFSI